MALGDVGQFVAEHPLKLGPWSKLHDEPGVDEDGTARHGEAFMLLCSNVGSEEGRSCGERFWRGGPQWTGWQPLFGVFHKRHTGADEHVELASVLFRP